VVVGLVKVLLEVVKKRKSLASVIVVDRKSFLKRLLELLPSAFLNSLEAIIALSVTVVR